MNDVSVLTGDGVPIDRVRLAAVCERYSVFELWVFGSVARENPTPDSDVDLLFTLAPNARLGFALFDLERELCELLGRQVDLSSKESIHHLIREHVLDEAKILYPAHPHPQHDPGVAERNIPVDPDL